MWEAIFAFHIRLAELLSELLGCAVSLPSSRLWVCGTRGSSPRSKRLCVKSIACF